MQGYDEALAQEGGTSDMDLGAAWIGLVGVAVGVVGTLLTTWMTNSANARQAKEVRRYEREQWVRELAADACVAAVDAVQWLSTMHVEDSVDPEFALEYEPKTEHAIGRLEQAREAMARVAALGGSEDLVQVAGDTVVALNVLGDAWARTRDYRRRQVQAEEGGTQASDPFATKRFNEEYARLGAARKALCGSAGALPWREIDQGNVLEGSLLYRLRQVTSSTTP